MKKASAILLFGVLVIAITAPNCVSKNSAERNVRKYSHMFGEILSPSRQQNNKEKPLMMLPIFRPLSGVDAIGQMVSSFQRPAMQRAVGER